MESLRGSATAHWDHESRRIPLTLPSGTLSPSGGEGWGEGVRFMGSIGAVRVLVFMTIQQFILKAAIGVYLVILVAIAYFTRATARRVAGAGLQVVHAGARSAVKPRAGAAQ